MKATPRRRARSLAPAVAVVVVLVLLSSAGLVVLGTRAYDAEEVKARLQARDRLAAAAREISAEAARILLEADHAAEAPEPPETELIAETFLVDAAGKILLPRLRAYPRLEPPPEDQVRAVESYLRKAEREREETGDPLEAVPFVEEAMGFHRHPDLAGVLRYRTAELYREGGRADRARVLLTEIVTAIPGARDLSGRPLAPAAYLDLLDILESPEETTTRRERALEFAECLAEHAWGLPPLERDAMLVRADAALAPDGIPPRIRNRVSFTNALRHRLIPEATALISGSSAGSWSHVVRRGATGTEILGWRVLGGEEQPYVHGYRLDPTVFRKRLSEKAESLAELHHTEFLIGISPPLRAGPAIDGESVVHEGGLGPEFAGVGLAVRLSPPGGPTKLRAIQIAMSVLLAAALLTGILLSVRALRREWQAARLRQDFIDNVSHELRTPLTSIRMYAEMLDEEADLPAEKRERYLAWVLRETERLSRLVEDVLDFSRLNRGEDLPLPSEVLPADLAREAFLLWDPLARENGFDVRVEVADELPAVRADRDTAVRALLNLLGNAIRYSGDGREVGILGERDGDRVLLSVWDHGPGIPSSARDHLFERFYRAPRDARQIKGVGLGLVLAREIARAGGGDVYLAETSEEGSRFVLALPVAGVDP